MNPPTQMTIDGLAPARNEKGQFTSSTKSSVSVAGVTAARPSMAVGPYSPYFSSMLPRLADPEFYEILREAIPLLDLGINRLVTLDGLINLEAESDKLQREAREWAEGVQVNHDQEGFQQAVSLWGGELYEQGFGLMEMVSNTKRNDVASLWIPDSKKIWFRGEKEGGFSTWYQPTLRTRRQTGATIQQTRRILSPAWSGIPYISFNAHDAVKLDPSTIVIGRHHPENQDPHGVSALRSIPFVAKMLLVINNAVLSTWERFGDPSFVGVQKAHFTGQKKKEEAETAAASLAADLRKVVQIKQAGGSADLTRIIGKDDSFDLKVLGADGEVLELPAPAGFVENQIVSGLHLSHGILGLPFDGDGEIAKRIILVEARTRFALRKRQMLRPVETAMRLRGYSFRPGDIELVQDIPDLDDVLKAEQARFMRKQGEAIYDPVINGTTPATIETDPAPADPPEKKSVKGILVPASKAPSLNREEIASLATSKVLSAWQKARELVSAGILKGLPSDAELLQAVDETLITSSLEWFVKEIMGGEDKPLDVGIAHSFDFGSSMGVAVINGAGSLLVQQVRRSAIEALKKTLFDQVTNETLASLSPEIVAIISHGLEDGENPNDVARKVHDWFGGSETRWVNVVRSELAVAVETGKDEEWKAAGVGAYVFLPGNPNCKICGPLAGTYISKDAPWPVRDTHGHCTCTRRPATKREIEAAGLTYQVNLIPNPNRDFLPEDLRT